MQLSGTAAVRQHEILHCALLRICAAYPVINHLALQPRSNPIVPVPNIDNQSPSRPLTHSPSPRILTSSTLRTRLSAFQDCKRICSVGAGSCFLEFAITLRALSEGRQLEVHPPCRLPPFLSPSLSASSCQHPLVYYYSHCYLTSAMSCPLH